MNEDELIDITDDIEFVYLTIPKPYVCIYHKLITALADYGENIITDCKCLCDTHNKELINCWNLFQSAIACYNIGEIAKADFFINYISKQLTLIYKGDKYKIYNGRLPLNITDNGKVKALVTCHDDDVKFEIIPSTGELLQIKGNEMSDYTIIDNNLSVSNGMKEYYKSLGKVAVTVEGDWENREYEKLSIVNYGDKSYISLKDVPKDVSINNREYWQEYCVNSYKDGNKWNELN